MTCKYEKRPADSLFAPSSLIAQGRPPTAAEIDELHSYITTLETDRDTLVQQLGTQVRQKRPVYGKRDPQKRLLCIWKETHERDLQKELQKRPMKEIHKRDQQKRPARKNY